MTPKEIRILIKQASDKIDFGLQIADKTDEANFYIQAAQAKALIAIAKLLAGIRDELEADRLNT